MIFNIINAAHLVTAIGNEKPVFGDGILAG
jgi:hypothetical protein